MSAFVLESLRAPELYSTVRDQFPNGMAFQESNVTALREIVAAMQAQLRKQGLRLRLRLDPQDDPIVPATQKQTPNRVVVIDGDLRWAIPVTPYESACIIDGRVTATAREDGVLRVVNALVSAIRRVLNV